MISKFFIDRPVAAWVVALMILIAGLICLPRMKIARFPEIAPPSIVVGASYSGASAQTAENTIAQIIEQNMTGIDGLLYFSTTTTSDGAVRLRFAFDNSIDVDVAQMQVQNRLGSISSRLPEQVQRTGINVNKVSDDTLQTIAFYSPNNSMSQEEISDFLVSIVQDPISRVNGVGDVAVYGSGYAIRVWLNQDRLFQYKLMPSDVVSAIKSQNKQISVGQLGGLPSLDNQTINVTIKSRSLLENIPDFENILVKVTPEGASVYLKDVARIEMGRSFYTFFGNYNKSPTASLNICLTDGANAVEVANLVHQELERLRPLFPNNLDYAIPYDTVPFITASLYGVAKTLLEALILVSLVILLFLRDLRATFIVSLTVPIVLAATVVVLYLCNYSINTLTMFAMVLAIGLLVDDAIVVVENVKRIIESQQVSPYQAAVRSMQEITSALFGVGLVISAVFTPMTFFSGATGNIYRQFSVTIVTAMLMSIMVATIITPALCATLLKDKYSHKQADNPATNKETNAGTLAATKAATATASNAATAVATAHEAAAGVSETGTTASSTTEPAISTAIATDTALVATTSADITPATADASAEAGADAKARAETRAAGKRTATVEIEALMPPASHGLGKLFYWIFKGYLYLNYFCLHHKFYVMLLFIGICVSTVYLFNRIPTSFLPVEDQGVLSVRIILPPSSTMEQTAKVGRDVENYFLEHEVNNVSGILMNLGTAGAAARGQNAAYANIRLTPWEERIDSHDSAQAILDRAKQYFDNYSGAEVRMSLPPSISGMGGSSGFLIYVQNVMGHSHEQFLNDVNQMVQTARANPLLYNVISNAQDDALQMEIKIDDQRAGQFLLDPETINDNLQVAWGGNYVNDFIDRGRIKRVYVQSDAQFRSLPSDLNKLYFRNTESKMVAFNSIGSIDWSYGPQKLERFNGLAAISLTGGPALGISSGQAMDEISRIIEEHPGEYGYAWSGISYQEKITGSNQNFLFMISAIVVFLCLAALYESWVIPLAVMLIVPVGIFGALLFVYMRGMTNDIYLQVGLLTTGGLSAKNAILIVEYAHQFRLQGQSLLKSAQTAASLRFRPIVMTSVAFLLGVLPLMQAQGAGAASQQSIGTGVFGGTVFATTLGLIMVPSFFVMISYIFQGHKHRPKHP